MVEVDRTSDQSIESFSISQEDSEYSMTIDQKEMDERTKKGLVIVLQQWGNIFLSSIGLGARGIFFILTRVGRRSVRIIRNVKKRYIIH